MNTSVSKRIAAASILVLSSIQLAAHDLWIEPSAFVTGVDKPVAIRLRVGVDLIGDPVARDAALIERFIALDQAGITPVQGADGVDPAGVLRIKAAGLTVIGYSSRPYSIALPAEKFNQYLSEEGLEAIAAVRAKRGETSGEAREEFARCAKALILSGRATAEQRDRALGFPLELIAEQNPYLMSPGQSLTVQLLYRGKPIENVLVIALNKRNPSTKLAARSGKDGRATFRLPDAGVWLVKAVHMRAADPGSAAQWSSLWASLTFQILEPARPPAGVPSNR
jgi:uncharacterized GH25 family protein